MRGVSLTHPELALFLCGEYFLYIPCWLLFFFFKSGEFLLHILCWLYFPVGSFSYTSPPPPPPPPFFLSFFFSFFLFFFLFFFFFKIWGVSYTSCAGFIFMRGVSLIHPVLAFPPLLWGVSLTHPMLALFLSWEFLLIISCWLHFYAESFSYTSRAAFSFTQGVSFTHAVLASFFFSFYLGSFSYSSHAGSTFYRRSFSYTSPVGFIFVWRVSLTHPVQVLKIILKICGVSLTHPVLAFFSFFFMWGASLVCSLLSRQPLKKRAGWKMAQKKKCEKVTLKTEKEPYNTLYRAEQNQTRVSLTHPLLASLCGAFFLHILCWLPYVGSFFMWRSSYTSCAGFFLYGVSLTCTVLASSCGEFLLHIPCWPLYAGYFSYISMLDSLCL